MQRLVFLFALTLASGACLAQVRPAFTLSAGYSDIHISRSAGDLHYDHDGGYVDGELSLNFGRRPVGLMLGVGVSASYHYDTEDFHNRDFNFNDNNSYLGFYSIEGRIGMPIIFSRSRRAASGFFLIPKLGAGLLVNDYGIDTNFRTEYHTGPAFEIRPAIQAGYSWGIGTVGVDLSHMSAWGDFGRLGNRAQEFRAGAFLRIRF